MTDERSRLVSAVMIGIDPHKGSHTAVAIDAAEEQLGTLQVRASASQASMLRECGFPALWPAGLGWSCNFLVRDASIEQRQFAAAPG